MSVLHRVVSILVKGSWGSDVCAVVFSPVNTLLCMSPVIYKVSVSYMYMYINMIFFLLQNHA